MEVKFINENDFELWDNFVDDSIQGNIFCKSKWLSILSNEIRILVVFENNRIIAGIPLPCTKKGIFGMPKLTPKLGVLFSNEFQKLNTVKRNAKEMESLNLLIKNLPSGMSWDYNFSENFTNYLPFIWNNYNVNLKYSYVINNLSDLDKVYSNFSYDTKYLIRKAMKNNIYVEESNDVKAFYEVNKKTFERQGMQIPYTYNLIEELYNKYKDVNAKVFIAKNKENEPIAGLFLLFDDECSYYLMGGADPKWRKYGSQTLLIWEAIKFSATVSKKFDFEGSMIPNIERAFREFGSEQKIYYNVEKNSVTFNLVYKFLRKHKNIIRKFVNV
ncbi:Acetyltransferase (GNAT) domain-containing protein [Clostridium cavendishii DSM 21758]|uniref:Acetyltransferase (GNAT) domain-containing protein n=1 Tax=Clostridium cavendishii DSM 21758 TaxID=1121302 RepID=A0A1M6Q7E4_9CLOT|nr:peptidoglycan bridge formation glycyltransferase FemA/FemB family protein [Clostridium cavendishii]SHK16068.1 Acetyltransferase (GNAT) domain-containing protein [Clostridium cavendishii DSM 21758]